MIINIFSKILSRIICFSPNLVEQINNTSIKKIHNIKFYIPNSLSHWRALTLFSKEPGTIKWIDSFKKNEIFWDIGSNIGIYSLYASINKKVKVISFEPSPINFHVLTRNIFLNKQSKNISPYCICLCEKTKTEYLNFSHFKEGAAHNIFGSKINEFGETMQTKYSQKTMGFRADDFLKLFEVNLPNHIKIDVDGCELLVIKGLNEILKNKKLKSILVELSTELKIKQHKQACQIIKRAGFKEYSREHPKDKRLTNYFFKRK